MNVTSMVAVPVLFALAGGCAAPMAPQSGDGLFELHEIVTEAAEHQIVLPGSFSRTAGPEIAILVVDPTGGRRLQLYGFDDNDWTLLREAMLQPEALFVDVAEIAGRDHVITYRDGSLNRFDAESGTEHRLVDLATDYRAPDDGRIPHIDVTRDVNGDGRDDFLMPDTDGIWVSTQSADGSFADAVKLGPAEPFLDAKAYGDERSYREVGITPQNIPWYLARVHTMDYDRDGRRDLVFWNNDHFDIYRQNEAGHFHPSPDTFTTDVPFDFDGSYAIGFQFGDASIASLVLGFGPNHEYTVLQGFRDLNADGIDDLVTFSLAGRRVLSLRGRHEVHFGRPTPGGTAFPRAPDTTAETPGSAAGQAWGYASQRFLDFDGDGMTDMAMGAVDTGLGGMIGAMVGNSISMDLALYRLHDGVYPEHPDVVRRVSTPFAPFDKRGVLFPTVLVGDVNGDGRSDLLTGETWDELSVFLGTPGENPLASQAFTVAVDLPSDERNARLSDLDNDGKEDVIIHHPSATEPNRLTILMAR